MNISIEHVTKKIKDATVLKDICLEMKGGTVYGLQGKNGSGKTMLMRAISGLIRPTSGRIVINGEQLHKNISIPRSIGLLLENPSLLPEYDASQNLKLLAKMQGGVPEEEIRQLIRDVGLDDAGHKKVEKYSLGMKQRLGIAAAILGSPDIILLDEPINAIDGEGVEEIRSLILSLKNEKRIIIVACHDKEEMNLLADEIVHLRDGRIEGQENGVADAVRQVLNYYKVRNPGTLLDHWLIMTAGTQPYQPNTLHSYKFPTIWLIMQAFMLLVVNGYTSGDLEEHGSVMIVKSRSRAGWWLSKCVWCMFSTLLAYVIYYIPMFLIFAWRGIPMKMHLTKRLVTTSVEGFLNWKTADVCAVVLFIPVAVMMFLCLLQMLLEVVWSPAVAIILLLVIQGISAYKQSVFLWGNWGIPVRMLKTPIGYIGNLRCSIAGIIVCIVIGTILFKRRDLLFKE